MHSTQLNQPSATDASASDDTGLPEISVNGESIAPSEIANEVQYHPASSREKAVHQAAQALVIKTLLRQQAASKALEANNEEAIFESLVERNVEYDKVSDKECERYFEQNKGLFKTAPIIEVSHILLAVAPDDIEGRANKKAQANKLIEQLKQDNTLFESYVADYSDCPSNKTAGSLGQITKGQTVPEFERQIFTLGEGLSEIAIESRYGFHIVFINRKVEGNQLEFQMVHEKIASYLNHRRYRQSVAEYLHQICDDAKIEGIELTLDNENIFKE